MRLLLATVLLVGCASRPVFYPRASDAPSPENGIWVVPATGDPGGAVTGFNDRFLGLLTQSGARVRQDAAWTVVVRISDVTDCSSTFRVRPSGRALVSVRHAGTLAEQFEVRASAFCPPTKRRWGAVVDASDTAERRVGAALALEVSDALEKRELARAVP